MRRLTGTNPTHTKREAIGAADAAAVKTLLLDLGLHHNYDRLCAVKRGLASANEVLIVEQAHDGDAETPTWVAAPMLVPGGMQSASYRQQGELSVSPPSGTDMVVWAAPCARWVRIKYTNGDTAQTDLVLELTAFPS
jgi:hypothetical protein